MVTTDTPTRQTRSSQITDQLRLQLSQGHFAPGQRYYSNARLAKDFGISVPTANLIINELCSDGLVRRQSGSGTYVTGQALQQTVVTYGIVLWIDLYDTATSGILVYEILACFERECANQGKKAQLFNLHDDSCLGKLQAAIEQGLNGVFLLSASNASETIGQAMDMLLAAGTPITVWDSLHRDVTPGVHCINFDEVQCGRTATRHLLTLGHQRIAFVGITVSGKWVDKRIEGYREALALAKIPARQQVVERIPAGDLKPSDLVALLRRLLQGGVTAIVAANDALAKELILIGRGMGIGFPEHLSIVGFDNRIDAHLMELTTIDRPADSLCKASLAILNQGQNADQVALPPAPNCPLIIRESTDPPPATPHPLRV